METVSLVAQLSDSKGAIHRFQQPAGLAPPAGPNVTFWPGLMALPPLGIGADPGGNDPAETGALREMVTMMFWYGSHLMFWQASLMWIAMIAFWGLLIWAIYALVANATHRSGGEHLGSQARQILDERLARGEIDTAEYQRLRDLISTDGPRAPVDAGSRR